MPSSSTDTQYSTSSSYPYQNELEKLFDEAVFFHKEGHLQQACELYEELLVRVTDNVAVLFYWSVACLELKRYHDSLEGILAACSLNPNDSNIYYQLGTCQQSLSLHKDSVSSFKEVVAMDPEHWQAYYNLGLALYNCGRFPEAIDAYCQAGSINPQDFDIHFNLGIAYKENGDFEKALAAYLHAEQLDPMDQDIHFNLGRLYKKMGHRQKAIERLEEAIQICPEFCPAYTNLGVLYVEEEMYDKAVQVYEQLIKLNYKSEAARHVLNALTGQKTLYAPFSYIQELYDGFADHFEQRLIEDLGYKTPFYFAQLLQQEELGLGRFKKLLDLGCGTGLCGLSLRDRADRLVGVDLSQEMLALAAHKGIYDDLIQSDISSFLLQCFDQYDLIVAGDVFIYTGDLGDIVKLMAESLAPEGCIIFSTEQCEDYGFTLRSSGRYAHSFRYIFDLAEENALSFYRYPSMKLRKENGRWIVGDIYILRKQ